MKAKFKRVISILVIIFIIITENKAQSNLDSLTKLVVISDRTYAIDNEDNLISYGKNTIPYLIDLINTDSTGFVSDKDPLSSTLYIVDPNYVGIRAAYIIERIISGENGYKVFPYKLGVIVKVNKGVPKMTPLSLKDMNIIEKIYKKWWAENKNNSLETLRGNWKNKKRILNGTGYVWK